MMPEEGCSSLGSDFRVSHNRGQWGKFIIYRVYHLPAEANYEHQGGAMGRKGNDKRRVGSFCSIMPARSPGSPLRCVDHRQMGSVAQGSRAGGHASFDHLQPGHRSCAAPRSVIKAAPAVGVTVTMAPVHDEAGIEEAACQHGPHSGYEGRHLVAAERVLV